MGEHVATIPSQVAHPWKATVRTFLAVLAPYVSLVLLFGPEVIRILAEELRGHVPDDFIASMLGVGLFIAAVSAAVTRIMAIPKVNELLGRIRLDAGNQEPTPTVSQVPEVNSPTTITRTTNK